MGNMREKCLKILIGVFCFFYLVLVYFVFNPNVSKAYHDYYISKISSLSPKELDLMMNLIPQKKYIHTSKDLGFIGWSHPETNHRWSDGPNSSIAFKIDDWQKLDGLLNLDCVALGRQNVSIFINDINIGHKIIEGELIFNITFNRALLRNGLNTLAFNFPDAHPPENGDQRILALALKSFQIR